MWVSVNVIPTSLVALNYNGLSTKFVFFVDQVFSQFSWRGIEHNTVTICRMVRCFMEIMSSEDMESSIGIYLQLTSIKL